MRKQSVLAAVFLLAAALLTVLLGATPAHALPPNTWVVNATLADDSSCTSGIRLCKTIQAAVTAATAGDTIEVMPGTYVEQIEITKNLTMVGAVSGGSIIQSPATLPISFTTSYANKPIVYIHGGATVNLQYLTVDGNGQGNNNFRFIGVAYYDAGGTVDHLTIVHVRETPANGDQHGNGLYGYNDDGISRTLTVTNNSISDFQKNGITLNGTNLTVNVSGNTVTGYGAISFTAQNGIQIGYGTTGTVGPANTISGFSYTPGTWSAAGILIFDSDATIQNNLVSNSQIGISTNEGNVTILGNTVTASTASVGTNAYWGIDVGDPPHAKPSPFDAGLTLPKSKALTKGPLGPSVLTANVAGNSLLANGPISASSAGLEFDAGYQGSLNMNATASGNTISGWGYGVYTSQCVTPTYTCYGGVFSSASVNYNNISGNSVGLGNDSASYTVNATDNWWGSAAGPVSPNNGVSGLVTTSPYARALTSSATASTHEIGETAVLTTSVTATGLYGAQLVVDHTSSVLNFTNGISINVGLTPPWSWDYVPKNFVATPGRTELSGSMSAGAGHTAGANLSGNAIAQWNYTCANTGVSPLAYDTTTGMGTLLSDINGFQIPSALTGDSISCVVATGSVNGTINLQGRLQNTLAPAGWNGAVVTLTCASGGCMGYGPYVFVTGTDGTYQLMKSGAGSGIVAGTYNATASRRAYLGATKSGIVVTQSGALSMTTPMLLGGDVNGDGTIDILDLSAIGAAFGTSVTPDVGPDINGDGFVNIFDLVLAGGNYHLTTSNWP